MPLAAVLLTIIHDSSIWGCTQYPQLGGMRSHRGPIWYRRVVVIQPYLLLWTVFFRNMYHLATVRMLRTTDGQHIPVVPWVRPLVQSANENNSLGKLPSHFIETFHTEAYQGDQQNNCLKKLETSLVRENCLLPLHIWATLMLTVVVVG